MISHLLVGVLANTLCIHTSCFVCDEKDCKKIFIVRNVRKREAGMLSAGPLGLPIERCGWTVHRLRIVKRS